MKTSLPMAVLAMLVLAACSTPESRIQGNAEAFNSWPADVQQKVRAGQTDVGFTEQMVLVALGAPDEKNTRTTPAGTEEVWIYRERGPRFSIGVGVGTGGRSSAYGGSVMVENNGFRAGEVMRVVLEGGRVVSVERRSK